jgi:hypothetical protein
MTGLRVLCLRLFSIWRFGAFISLLSNMRDTSIVIDQIDTNGEPLSSLAQKQTHISHFVLSKPTVAS